MFFCKKTALSIKFLVLGGGGGILGFLGGGSADLIFMGAGIFLIGVNFRGGSTVWETDGAPAVEGLIMVEEVLDYRGLYRGLYRVLYCVLFCIDF